MQGLTVHGYRSGIAAKVKTALKTLAFAASLQTLCLSSSAPAGENALFLSDQRTPRPHRSWQPAWERPRRPSEKKKKPKKKEKAKKKNKAFFVCLSANSQRRANQTPWDGPHTGSRSTERFGGRGRSPFIFFFLSVAPGCR